MIPLTPPKPDTSEKKKSTRTSIFRRNSFLSKNKQNQINTNTNDNNKDKDLKLKPTLNPSSTSLASDDGDNAANTTESKDNNNNTNKSTTPPRKTTLGVFADSIVGYFTDDDGGDDDNDEKESKKKDNKKKDFDENDPSPMIKSFPNANKILSRKDWEIIFSDVNVIYGLNKRFLDSLNTVIFNQTNNWFDNSKISDPFETFTPLFGMYQNYMNKYTGKVDCITKNLNKKIKLDKKDSKQKNSSYVFVEYDNIARKHCNGQNLQSLIILPIQRLPRYKLLLTEILKNTEKGSDGYKDLENALNNISKLTSTLNSRMKEFDARQKVGEIERRFVFESHKKSNWTLMKPHRAFVKEGKLSKIDRTGKANEKTFFLFSDCIIYATNIAHSKELTLNQEIPINEVFSIKDIKDTDNSMSNFGNRGFEIHSSVKSFIVFAKTFDEKKSWINEINKVTMKRKQSFAKATQSQSIASNPSSPSISNDSSFNGDEKTNGYDEIVSSSKKLKVMPLLIPDNYSNVCMASGCNTKFGTFNRRHHCRECGYIICGKCGNNQIKIPASENQGQAVVIKPVCNAC